MIMEMLSQLQNEQLVQTRQMDYADAVAAQLNIPQLMDELLVAKDMSQSHSLGEIDNDAINLVEMLFQFILDDRNLAPVMKVLIARLQIPFVKVALKDKSFFSRGGHPARKLLNEIATAALGWTPPENDVRDLMLKKVEQVVERLLDEFVDDAAIFQDLLTDFVSFVETDKRRAGLVEQRTLDAEDGRAKTEAARSAVQEIIEAKMAHSCIPDIVIKLLREAWSNVLFLIYFREGMQSGQWQEAVEVMDELLWSVQPVEQIGDRQQLLKRLPELLKNLRKGLTQIGYDPFDMNQLFSELETEHLKNLKRRSTDALAPKQQPQSVDATLSMAQDSRAERVVAPDSVVETPGPVSLLENEIQAQAESQVEQVQSADAALAGTQETEEVIENTVDEQNLTRIDNLSTGSWVEFTTENETKLRCRLAAIIKPNGRYIFVNRSGRKVAERDREELALDLQNEQVNFLDEGLLFDRALESVIGNLRTLKNQQLS